MMKKLFACLLTLLMLGVCAVALAGATAMPDDIKLHMARDYTGYTVESAARMPDTPQGDLELALLKNAKERVLLIYRVKDGKWRVWIETNKAIPQHPNEARIEVIAKGQAFTEMLTEQQVISDGLHFKIDVRDDNGETTEQSAWYHYEDGTFLLMRFRFGIVHNFYTQDGAVAYWNLSSGRGGTAYGVLERDIRYLRFDTLPKTYAEARNSLTVAPDVPKGRVIAGGGSTISAKEIKFTGGRNYPVYLGPGERYARSGNGKGTVSTNDWIQVFGQYGGYIMIQYEISAERYRIGWIEASALPSGASVPYIDLSMLEDEDYGEVIQRCVFTDDPFISQTALAQLAPGTTLCEVIFNMGGWSYVRVTLDGNDVCGFVPSDCISHG